MIERKFVAEKMKELQVNALFAQEIGKDKYTSIEIKKTPLGDKIIVYTTRPGMVVGKKGENIKRLTEMLKTKFKMENPEVEVAEISKPELDAQSMAEYIVNSLERFGPKRFKSIGYKALQRIIDAGALGAEIVISGRGVPSSRAKSWRFYEGYLKKSGDISESFVSKGLSYANLKSGTVGVKVSIMTPDISLPDKIIVKEPDVDEQLLKAKEDVKEDKAKDVKEEKNDDKSEDQKVEKKKASKKKTSSKKSKKKDKQE